MLWVLDDARIDDDAFEVASPEGVVVRAEDLAISLQAGGGRAVADVMVASHTVERDLRVQLVRHAHVFRDLGRVAGFVDQISGDHDECGMQAVGARDSELEVRRLMREVHVIRVHPKLRVGHLEEERGLRRGLYRHPSNQGEQRQYLSYGHDNILWSTHRAIPAAKTTAVGIQPWLEERQN